jgi:hypothetical protein
VDEAVADALALLQGGRGGAVLQVVDVAEEPVVLGGLGLVGIVERGVRTANRSLSTDIHHPRGSIKTKAQQPVRKRRAFCDHR